MTDGIGEREKKKKKMSNKARGHRLSYLWKTRSLSLSLAWQMDVDLTLPAAATYDTSISAMAAKIGRSTGNRSCKAPDGWTVIGFVDDLDHPLESFAP